MLWNDCYAQSRHFDVSKLFLRLSSAGGTCSTVSIVMREYAKNYKS